jgi:hypothetical protein
MHARFLAIRGGMAPLSALALAIWALSFPRTVLAVAPGDTLGTYQGALQDLARTYSQKRRPILRHEAFARRNWVDRTALLNVVCAHEAPERCGAALELGLGDEALVVRDHAFRLLVAGPDVPDEMKARAARRILEDDRNYRRGRGLWIVDRARNYLERQGR